MRIATKSSPPGKEGWHRFGDGVVEKLFMPNRDLLTQFGQRIRELRTARGLTQEKLAELTGFHRTYIGMIETQGYSVN